MKEEVCKKTKKKKKKKSLVSPFAGDDPFHPAAFHQQTRQKGDRQMETRQHQSKTTNILFYFSISFPSSSSPFFFHIVCKETQKLRTRQQQKTRGQKKKITYTTYVRQQQ